jgi:hypothetical protein
MSLSVQPTGDPKWRFLEEIFVSNSIAASFSVRAGGGIYASGITEEQRSKLREVAKRELRELALGYSAPVSEDQHIQNISNLAASISHNCSLLLSEGGFRFGIAQKALNVYLKYLWCANQIPTPPHCPFDSIVIGKLKLLHGSPDQWTKIVDASPYKEWVSAAKLVAAPASLAEWELTVWQG